MPSRAAPPAIRNGPQTTYQLSPLLREYQMKASENDQGDDRDAHVAREVRGVTTLAVRAAAT